MDSSTHSTYMDFTKQKVEGSYVNFLKYANESEMAVLKQQLHYVFSLNVNPYEGGYTLGF